MKMIEYSYIQYIPKNKKDKIKFYYENSGRSTIIETDVVRLEQILTNIIMNAIKFTEQGEIKFGFKVKENGILFYIEDTGIGIEEEYSQIIFDRFTRIDNSNVEILHQGTGLGLSIAKKVIELLKGEIWVESIFGKGSIFYFTLPLTERMKQ